MKDYTEKEILMAIKDSAGIMTTIAKNLGCDWSTARKYTEMYDSTKEAYFNEGERVLDLAESKLIEAINKGDSQMIKYLLATKGKKRGFTEKQIIEHEITDIDKKIDTMRDFFETSGDN